MRDGIFDIRRIFTLKSKVLKFTFVQLFYWSIWASFAAFAITYGLARGYSQSSVSIMVACYYVFAFIGQFLWGSIADKMRTNKWVFLIGIVSGELMQLGMYFSKSMPVYLAFYLCLGLLMAPMSSILDTWTLKSLDFDVGLYSRARSFGTAGYAVCILIMGKAISAVGYVIMPIVLTVVLSVTVILAVTTPDAPVTEVTREKISLKDISSIFKVPIYTLVVAAAFFIGLSISPANNLKIMVLQSVGGDVSTQGIDSFVGCISQFLMFFFSGSLGFIKPRIRLLLGGVTVFFALLIDLLATNSIVVIISTFLIYGSYSLIIPAAREIVVKNIDYKYQTTANGLVDSVYTSLAGTIALLFAGSIAENYGIKLMLTITLCTSVIPVLLMIFAVMKSKRQNTTN